VSRGLFGGLGLILLLLIALVAWLAVFTVDPTRQALVLRFGETIRAVSQPGLYTKVPLIDNVVYIERRLLDLDSPPLEIIASDQKRLVVDAFGRYRVTDALLFYQTVGTVAGAEARLSVILNSAVRRVLGEASFTDLVSTKRAELMERITEQVNREGLRLGLAVQDVKIRRADLPEANSQAIYQRMQTERQQEATQIRAEGEQQARRIRAEADRQATVIVAEANRESEQLRGDGDAAVNRTFANAFGRDPEFFAFYRSMQAYQAGLQPGSTRLVMSPNSDFFRFFNAVNGSDEAPVAGDPPAEPVAPIPVVVLPGADADAADTPAAEALAPDAGKPLLPDVPAPGIADPPAEAAEVPPPADTPADPAPAVEPAPAPAPQ